MLRYHKIQIFWGNLKFESILTSFRFLTSWLSPLVDAPLNEGEICFPQQLFRGDLTTVVVQHSLYPLCYREICHFHSSNICSENDVLSLYLLPEGPFCCTPCNTDNHVVVLAIAAAVATAISAAAALQVVVAAALAVVAAVAVAAAVESAVEADMADWCIRSVYYCPGTLISCCRIPGNGNHNWGAELEANLDS